MRRLIPAMSVIAISGMAHAEVIHWTQLVQDTQSQDAQDPVWGNITIDLSGLESYGFQGNPGNAILSVFYGASATITSVAWDVTITTFDVSWAEEVTISLNGQNFYNPAAGDAFGVSNMNYQGSQSANVFLGSDGFLNIELHEIGFDDVLDGPDAVYEQGSYLYVGNGLPAPGALSSLGLFGFWSTRRRRSANPHHQGESQ